MQIHVRLNRSDFINHSTSFQPVDGYSNTNFKMIQVGSPTTQTYLIINIRTGDVVASGTRDHVVRVWNRTGTETLQPMAYSA